jgi:hypothetical protein
LAGSGSQVPSSVLHFSQGLQSRQHSSGEVAQRPVSGQQNWPLQQLTSFVPGMGQIAPGWQQTRPSMQTSVLSQHSPPQHCLVRGSQQVLPQHSS